MTGVLHSSESAEWYTPPPIVEAARATMGGIDLDPFSSAGANQIVRAAFFFQKNGALDGFLSKWGEPSDPSRVFVNPPSGKFSAYIVGAGEHVNAGGAQLAWWRMLDEFMTGNIEQGVFVCFSLNVFQTSQRYGYLPPCAFPHCIPERRLSYTQPGRLKPSAPPHPSAVAFLPPKGNTSAAATFCSNFKAFGYVRA